MLQNNQIIDLGVRNGVFISRLHLSDNEDIKQSNKHKFNEKNSAYFCYSDGSFGYYKIDLYLNLLNEISGWLTTNGSIMIIIGSICDDVNLFNNTEIVPNIILASNLSLIKCNNRLGVAIGGCIYENIWYYVRNYEKLLEVNQHCINKFNLIENINTYKKMVITDNLKDYVNCIDFIISPFFPVAYFKKSNQDLKEYLLYNRNVRDRIYSDSTDEEINYIENHINKIITLIESLKKESILICTCDIFYGSIQSFVFKKNHKNYTWMNCLNHTSIIRIFNEPRKSSRKKQKKIVSNDEERNV